MNGSVRVEESEGGTEEDWMIEETKEEGKNEIERSSYNRTFRSIASLWKITPGVIWKIVYNIFGGI
jgi:hypothetical protein